MFPGVNSSFSASKTAAVAFLLAFLCAVSNPSSFAQSDPQKATPAETTSINVNEVSLDLVVRNKRGGIVPDLKPEDLAVTDGGTPVKLSSLRLVYGDGQDHLVTMVFDRMDSAAGTNAREMAAKILKQLPPAGFSVCVMKASGRLLLFQEFTSDRKALTSAIAQAIALDQSADTKGAAEAEKRLLSAVRSATGEAGTSGGRTAAQALLAALQESQKMLTELHTQPGLAGLMALARAEQRIRGRKTVIYFTPGLQEDSTSADRLREIVEAANRAGVSIYVVVTTALSPQADQSLMAMMAMGSARAAAAQTPAQPAFTTGADGTRTAVPQGPPGLAPMISSQMDRFEMGDPNAVKSPLTVLTEATGGAFVTAGEDIKKPVGRMVTDMTIYYDAEYVSPVQNFDGQFRPITVKPLRAGLKVSSRPGYFALPPDLGNAVRAFEGPLLKTLDETQLPSDVELHAKVLQLGELPNGDGNTVVIETPVKALQTTDDTNSNMYSLHAAMVMRIKNKAGAVVEHFGEDIPRHGALDAKDAAQAGSITMQRHFSAEPGEYVLEAAVFDYQSGKSGAQRLTFTISKPAPGPFLSDIAMVDRIDPVPEEADPTEPLRYGSGRVMARALESADRGKKDLSFFFVVHPDADSTEQPSLEMELLKGGEPITQAPLAFRKTTAPAAVPYLTSIQTAGLPGGDYSVIERLSQGGRIAERTLAFHIAGAVGEEPGGTLATTKGGSEGPGELSAAPIDGPSGHSLTITSLSSTEVPPPTAEQLEAIVAQARKRALEYGKALPNFMCVEVTNRSVDQAGSGSWRHRDSLAELLTYHDNTETRTTLEVNGVHSTLKRTELNTTWPISVGEFGAILNLVFKPSSKTEFVWKEAATMGDGSGTVQVLSYRVSKENATVVLTQGNDQVGLGFKGSVYIDATTGGVRRVTLQADDVPHNFAFHAASVMVDYNYVAIAGRDYLVPVRSTVTLQRGRRQIEMNEISFRNYRRFASRTKIKVLQ